MLQLAAEISSFGHDGDTVSHSSVEFIETPYKIHVPADVEEFFGKIHGIFHHLFYFAFHLELHLDHILIKKRLPCFSTFFVSSLFFE